MTQTHSHDGCGCDHDHAHEHNHEHAHDHNPLSVAQRWILSLVIIIVLLFLLRPFIVSQMLVRVTSYSAIASYMNAIRICKKIIAIDRGNVQAWTALGYAYMDISQTDNAIPVFEKVLNINPRDRGAASYELGQAYYSKGDYNKAIEYFERIRSAGPEASSALEADILRYRHGTLGFRSLNSMQTLLGDLLDCYQKTGNLKQASEVQKEYDILKNKHRSILF